MTLEFDLFWVHFLASRFVVQWRIIRLYVECVVYMPGVCSSLECRRDAVAPCADVVSNCPAAAEGAIDLFRYSRLNESSSFLNGIWISSYAYGAWDLMILLRNFAVFSVYSVNISWEHCSWFFTFVIRFSWKIIREWSQKLFERSEIENNGKRLSACLLQA